MFSPSSGSLNSPAVAGAGSRVAIGFRCNREAGAGVWFAGVAEAAAARAGVAGAGFSGSGRFDRDALEASVFDREDDLPHRSLSPSFTRISPIVPLTDEGTSTTALSVSSSITGSPSAMLRRA
jgi:hypothetical protein